jgi:hypothetical protein
MRSCIWRRLLWPWIGPLGSQVANVNANERAGRFIERNMDAAVRAAILD